MKKIIIALIAVLGVAVNANAQKFGHVDTQSIMQSLPEVTKVNGELQATMQQYDNELKTMQEEIQRKADEYIQKKQEELMGPIYQKIRTAIENVGKAGNYTYILEASSALYIGTGSTDVTAAVKVEINKIK